MPRKRAAAGAPLPTRGRKQSIAFGIVNIPVQLKPAIEARTKRTISANYVCPTHKVKVSTKRYCPQCDADVDAVKMYPHEGDYVQLDEDVLDQIVAEKTGEIRIEHSVKLDDVPRLYLNKPYLVYPGEGGAGTLDVLTEAIRSADAAAVGTAVLGTKTEQIVIYWEPATETLIAHTSYFDADLRWNDIGLVQAAAKSRPAPAAATVKMGVDLLTAMAGDFDPEEVEDEYTPALADAIAQAAGTTPKPKAKAAAAEPEEVGADDVMAALKASLAAAKGKPAAKKKAVKA